jgi:hypothetical protein
MNDDSRNPKDKAELIDTGHSASRKPYSAPEITFIEDLEVVAGTCAGGKTPGGGGGCSTIATS